MKFVRVSFWRAAVLALALVVGAGGALGKPGDKDLLLVVLDPLAKELACACVKGYGQRDYRKLAARLEAVLKQPVGIEFSDDLAETMAAIGQGREVMVVGERSRILKGALAASLKCVPVLELTDPDGETSLNGAFVTRAGDSAKELKDIGGRQLLFGLSDTPANEETVQAALKGAGVQISGAPAKRDQYTDAVLDMIDSTDATPPVAVIPHYALRLMEGCGTLKPGEIKVIGKTRSVPFVTFFLAEDMPAAKRDKVIKALLDIKGNASLLEAMESRDGFKQLAPAPAGKPKADASGEWPDWRGSSRDGKVARLPEKLPAKTVLAWKKAAMPASLAGLSVSGNSLILAERDFTDENDVYRCLNTENGELIWRVEYPAMGSLDYGQSPRATPVIHQGKAYLLGAFGELRCVNLADGKLIWKRHLPSEFEATLPTWGMCSTPLVVDGMLIVNPGGAKASLAALDAATGATRWAVGGAPAAYSAFICAEFGGKRQIVGYDQHSLGGWEVSTGKRLWQLVPPKPGDFNVPTPIAWDGGLLVSTENNGTRFYRFDKQGRIIAKPQAEFSELSPDTMTPVVTGGRVFGTHNGLHCLDVGKGLKPVWQEKDEAPGDFAAMFADEDRVLVVTITGELLLVDARKQDKAVISRLRVFEDEVEMYSHPALVGNRLFMRAGSNVLCVDLAAN